MFHADFDFKSLPTFRKTLSLKKHGVTFSNVTCSAQNTVLEELKFDCFFFGDSRIVQVQIAKQTWKKTKRYFWSLRPLAKLSNALYTEAFDAALRIDDLYTKRAMFLRNAMESPLAPKIVYYNIEAGHEYATYIHELPTTNKMLGYSLSQDEQKLYVYYVAADNEIMVDVLGIGEY